MSRFGSQVLDALTGFGRPFNRRRSDSRRPKRPSKTPSSRPRPSFEDDVVATEIPPTLPDALAASREIQQRVAGLAPNPGGSTLQDALALLIAAQDSAAGKRKRR